MKVWGSGAHGVSRLAVMAGYVVALSAMASPAQAAAPSAGWSSMPTPIVVTRDNDLRGAAVVPATSIAWAVGSTDDGTARRTLAERWNGSAWTIVSTPNSGPTAVNALIAVSAASASSVWAVGSGGNAPLAERFDGVSWSIQPVPMPAGAIGGVLNGVKALSSSDAWAVGEYIDSGSTHHTLVEHWNGAAWSVVVSPDVSGADGSSLFGVSAVSASDVWAVGSSPNSGITSTLVEHWNGSAWSIVASPNPGSLTSGLVGVSALAANDVWAVGFDDNGGGFQTLIEHWNGTTWSQVASVSPTSPSSLNSMVAVSTNNAWAVGSSGSGDAERTLVEHWNGSSWSRVGSPNGTTFQGNALEAVAAMSATSVLAVGFQHVGPGIQTLAERYSGTAWSLMPSPNANAYSAQFNAVVAIDPTHVWAVGAYSPSGRVPLAELWNGSRWQVMPVPAPGGVLASDAVLLDVAAISANDIWAVGTGITSINNQTGNAPFVEHWNGTAWSLVAQPVSDSAPLGVVALSTNDVWAGGYDPSTGALLEHWNGSSWTSSTPAASGPGAVDGFAAFSPSDVWASGDGSSTLSMVEHWDGSAWTTANAFFAGGSATLAGLDGISSADIWGVGYDYAFDRHGLIYHWNGSAWSQFGYGQPIGTSDVLKSVNSFSGKDGWLVGSRTPAGSSTTPDSLAAHWNGVAWSRVNIPISSSYDVLNDLSAPAGGCLWAAGYVRPSLQVPQVQRLCPVQVGDAGLSPAAASESQGLTAAWSFPVANSAPHSIREQDVGLFASPSTVPGGSFVFTPFAAATYTILEDAGTPGQHTGTLAVPLKVSPATGATTTTFTFTMASKVAPAGDTYELQVDPPGAAGFATVSNGTARTFSYTPNAGPGTYVFQARLDKGATHTGFSPTLTITVS
jgi:hypothetical protein